MGQAKNYVTLPQLRRDDCCACRLHESASHICVMGRGSDKAKLVLIAEAPGKIDEERGMPFMGVSGRALQKLLDRWEIDCYLTTICKCRPPYNRSPKLLEITMCTQRFLDFELKMIEPRLIVLLGTVAIKHFIKVPNVELGAIYKSTKWPFEMMGTWHPAYALRSDTKYLTDIEQHLKTAQIYANKE